MIDIRTARILADPAWYGGVVAAVFVADADLQYHDTQNAYRVLYEAIHQVKLPASRAKHTAEQAFAVQQTLDAITSVFLNGHVEAFVRAAVTAATYLAANNPAAAYHALAMVMSVALGNRDHANIAPQRISAA